jgi:hypothetical protein
MSDRDSRDGHGDLDSWLHERIEPLSPPPGTFDAIRRRARRRKYRKLAVSAGAAAVVIAAAVAVPQVVKLPVETGKPVASSSTAERSTSPGVTSGPVVEASSEAPIPLPSGNPVPANFQPSSLTAVSTSTIFTIGQAGTPGHCATSYCTSVARTRNAGGTWTGLPAPLTGAPDGATGVGQIRFLEGINGWAFGPELWATHDGGENWTQIDTHNQRVIDVETVGNRAFAIEATCAGTGAQYAAQCTSFTLYSTPATKDAWTKVGATTTGLTAGSNTGSTSTGAAALILTGTRGYLLAPDGTLYEGPVNGTAAWQSQGQIPCATGEAQPDGQPAGALLGAITASNLILDCTSTRLIYASSSGGQSWQHMWTAPTAGTATSIAASPAYAVILATEQGIEVLPSSSGNSGAASWRPATLNSTSAPVGGFIFVGMTNPEHGMALPASPTDGTAWFTTDGGLVWTPSAVQGPS